MRKEDLRGCCVDHVRRSRTREHPIHGDRRYPLHRSAVSRRAKACGLSPSSENSLRRRYDSDLSDHGQRLFLSLSGKSRNGSPGGIPRFRERGRAAHRRVPALAGLTGAGGAHLPARRGLVGHRGAGVHPGALGAVAEGRPGPAAGAERAHARGQRGRPARPPGGLAAARRRRGRLRLPLPAAVGAAGAGGHRRHDHRAGLGDERRHLHQPVPAGPRGVEGVLEAHRAGHALGPGGAVPFRFRGDARDRRHPLGRLLSGRRRGGHHRFRRI